MATRRKVKSPAPATETAPTHRTTGINLPADMWEMLNRVAFERAKKHGGRPSVSALLVDLVERHRKELEKELAG
jgi:hypothetical protein